MANQLGLDFWLQGFATVKSEDSEPNLIEIRGEIEEAFEMSGFPSVIYPCLLKSQQIGEVLLKKILSMDLMELMNQLSERAGDQVFFFPHLEVMRNYFSCPKFGRNGWHSDCNGELDIPACQDLLRSQSYVFGKVGMYLQFNTNFGGQIDVIPRSHLGIRKSGHSVHNIPVKLSNQLLKLGLGRLAFSNRWVSDLPVFNKVKLDIDPFDLVIFDSGLCHRGTPLSNESLRFLENIKAGSFDGGSHLRGLEVDLQERNKYAIYLQFGTRAGLQSYYYDRFNRPAGVAEFKLWRDHFESDIFMSIPGATCASMIFSQICSGRHLDRAP